MFSSGPFSFWERRVALNAIQVADDKLYFGFYFLGVRRPAEKLGYGQNQ